MGEGFTGGVTEMAMKIVPLRVYRKQQRIRRRFSIMAREVFGGLDKMPRKLFVKFRRANLWLRVHRPAEIPS